MQLKFQNVQKKCMHTIFDTLKKNVCLKFFAYEYDCISFLKGEAGMLSIISSSIIKTKEQAQKPKYNETKDKQNKKKN